MEQFDTKPHKKLRRQEVYLNSQDVKDVVNELQGLLAEHPDAVLEFDNFECDNASVEWWDDEDPIEIEARITHEKNNLEGERKTFERLKAKFEPSPAAEAQAVQRVIDGDYE